ncbi:uncharacterized protein LOC142569037 [Dermacentor variabilis]|uniref:uncharacterized protein LOC142569037 n=1 Tax=Dermacentor variabilis TaxID=34621 RepID=UPI003F5BFC06
MTSSTQRLKVLDPAFLVSGQDCSSTNRMLNRVLFFVQVRYFKNAHCLRSDDRCLLLLSYPQSFLSCFMHALFCANRLVLSGDIELNPGPTRKTIRNTGNSDETSCSSAEPDNDLNNISGMLTELLAGQKTIARDIADIKVFQQTVNKRFDALESRVAALEKTSADPSVSLDHSGSDVRSLSQAVSELIKKNDDLENRSRRNNIILHGLGEHNAENTDMLLSNVHQFFTEKLQIECPPIERCHRIGTKREGRSRPVILRVLDFRNKVEIMKIVSKLKGTKFYITEDYSANVRTIHKKLWAATSSFRDHGSVVRLRYDRVFINGVRYRWNDAANALVDDSGLAVNTVVNNSSLSENTLPATSSSP